MTGFLVSFSRQGFLPSELGLAEVLWKALATSIVGAAVEALPVAEYDNLTVAAASTAAARLLFGF